MSISTILNDRTIIKIEGEDRFKFLQGLITNDIYKLNHDKVIYACLLTPQGKYFADFFIYAAQNYFLVDIPSPRQEEILRKLNLYKLRSLVTITACPEYRVVSFPSYHFSSVIPDVSAGNLNSSVIPDVSAENLNSSVIPDVSAESAGDRGSHKNSSDPRSALQCSLPGMTQLNQQNNNDQIIFADPRKKVMGFRGYILESELADITKNLKSDQHAYDMLRINNFVAEGDKDLIPETSFILEYGLEKLNAVDFKKGCYVGQELVARTHHRGTIRKQIAQVEGNSNLPKHGAIISSNEKKIGIICSSIYNKALALIRTEDFMSLDKNAEIFVESQRIKLVFEA